MYCRFSVDLLSFYSGSFCHISLLLPEAGAKRKGYGLEHLGPASRSLLGDNYSFITLSILSMFCGFSLVFSAYLNAPFIDGSELTNACWISEQNLRMFSLYQEEAGWSYPASS